MKAIITNIIKETEDISSFRLKPDEELKYMPGQWMYVRLSPELKHHFTISSSPTEPFLQFTTKSTGSEYKKELWTKKTDDTVEINGSFGSFVLDESDTTPRLFIAGGIGITPFRSMMKYLLDKNSDLPHTLLYSVKSANEAAFKDLLLSSSNTRVIETELEGRIDEEKIHKYCPDWKERTWWVCGPPSMVIAFVELAQKMGVAPEKIKSEEFTGY
jgi:glycine betaine catabolism B